MYRHPNQKIGKLDDICKQYVVIKSAGGNGLVYQIKAEDPLASDAIIGAHINDLKANTCPSTDIPPSTPDGFASSDPAGPFSHAVNFNPHKPLFTTGLFIAWQDKTDHKLKIGKITYYDGARRHIKAQVYGTPSHLPKLPIDQRHLQPSWDQFDIGTAVYANKPPDLTKATINTVPEDTVLAFNFKLLLDGTLPPPVASHLSTLPGALLTPQADGVIMANVLTDFELCHALATATTHQDVDYRSLSPEDVELMQLARDEELRRFEHYKVYTKVHIGEIPNNVLVLPSRFVDTRKIKVGGI